MLQSIHPQPYHKLPPVSQTWTRVVSTTESEQMAGEGSHLASFFCLISHIPEKPVFLLLPGLRKAPGFLFFFFYFLFWRWTELVLFACGVSEMQTGLRSKQLSCTKSTSSVQSACNLLIILAHQFALRGKQGNMIPWNNESMNWGGRN